jgi:Fic family protein
MSQKRILTGRQEAILYSFKYRTRYQISEITTFEAASSISLATLKRDLSQMLEIGYIDTVGEKRGTLYVLNERGLLFRTFPLDTYFKTEVFRENTLLSYNFELFDILKNVDLFSKDELTQLETETRSYRRRGENASDTIYKKELERFVIELSWKSSKIEGNTYTLLDTERLIRDGVASGTNTKEEALMILNHKKAFSYILELIHGEKRIETFREIENIHRLLVEGLGVNHGMRKSAVGITGTRYIPLSTGAQIEEETRTLIELIEAKKDFFSKALLAILGISYLQSFEDGNKRTGRLFANALLLMGKCAPLSYRDVDEKTYRESALVFYEQNSIEPFKKLFIEQYIFSCRNYNIA